MVSACAGGGLPLPQASAGAMERLRDRHGLDPRHCLMAGDKMDDLLFAVNAGLATGLLVLTGKGKDQALRAGLPVPETGCVALDSVSGPLGPVHRALASDFGAATDWILSGEAFPLWTDQCPKTYSDQRGRS